MIFNEIQHRSYLLVSTLLMLALLVVGAMAQTETGQILGKVADQAGAVVSAADVTVKSPNTGLTRTTTTNSDGLFTITNLQPGVYDVSVKATGFSAKSASSTECGRR